MPSQKIDLACGPETEGSCEGYTAEWVESVESSSNMGCERGKILDLPWQSDSLTVNPIESWESGHHTQERCTGAV